MVEVEMMMMMTMMIMMMMSIFLQVKFNRPLCVVILSIWSWSLLQFTMVMTATKKTKEAAPKSLLGIQQGLYSTFKSAPKRHYRSPAATPITPHTPKTLFRNVDASPLLESPTVLRASPEAGGDKVISCHRGEGKQAYKISKKHASPRLTRRDSKESFLINLSDDDDDDDVDDDEDRRKDEENDKRLRTNERGVNNNNNINNNNNNNKTNKQRHQRPTTLEPLRGHDRPSSRLPSPCSGEDSKAKTAAKMRDRSPLANPLLQRGPTRQQQSKRPLLLPPITARGFPRLSPIAPKSSSSRTEAAVQMEPCCTPEVYGILISMFLQDAPFLVLRWAFHSWGWRRLERGLVSK